MKEFSGMMKPHHHLIRDTDNQIDLVYQFDSGVPDFRSHSPPQAPWCKVPTDHSPELRRCVGVCNYVDGSGAMV